MGNTRSEFFQQSSVDLWWDNDQTRNAPQMEHIDNPTTTVANDDRLAEVKREISSLHEKRLKLIAAKKKEMEELRQEVARQKKENDELKQLLREKNVGTPVQEWDTPKVHVGQQTETFEVPGISQDAQQLQAENYDLQSKVEKLQLELANAEATRQKNLELQICTAQLQRELQGVNAELQAFENERQEYKTHVTALKDIITVSKQLLLMRENQIKELTQKVTEIQASLAEKELAALSGDLREEYERQLRNIRQLRALYEERQRADRTEINNVKSQLEESSSALQAQEIKNSELETRITELETQNSEKYDSISSLESQLGLTKAECGELRAEMSVINQLFSQILLGFNNGQEIDLDKLIKILEENHDLLTDIVVKEECTEISSALPKVLLDLVNQVNGKVTDLVAPNSQEEAGISQNTVLSTIAEESESQTSTQQNSLSSASEIVQNLPKVWRVLTELLSHQSAPVSVLSENNELSDKNPCYKSVQTPTGPTLVLSVSKTFIRLKNLILEKKSLEKETMRLKQLNTHLETRLQDQEKRLGTVSDELSKTWHVVGKMQKQHQQLHTQEKILRYELAQKRKLLTELKEELEYCREKWLQAREKNSTTEEQWKQLRTEFASRKNTISEDLNNSVESGYSDERESSSDDDVEAEYESEPLIASPDMVPEFSTASEDVETASEHQDEDKSSSEEIMDVIVEEIAKLESCFEAYCQASSSQQMEDAEALALNPENALPPPCSNEGNSESAETRVSAKQLQQGSECSSMKLSTEVQETQQHVDIPDTLNFTAQQLPLEAEALLNLQLSSQYLENQTEAETTGASAALLSITFACEAEPTEIFSSLPLIEETSTDVSVTLHQPEEFCCTNVPTSSLQQEEINSVNISPSAVEDSNITNSPIASASTLTSSCLSEKTNTTETSASPFEQEKNRIINSSVSLPQQEHPDNDNNTNIRTIPDENPAEPSSPLLEISLVASDYESKEIVQNGDGSTEPVHSIETETLKTDLVQNVNHEVQKTSRTPEEILTAREERLKRLEEQAKDLVVQTTNTSNRSIEICTKLENLHEQYGNDSNSRRRDIDDMYKKLEEDILQTIKKTQSGEDYPSTSKQSRSTEEILAAREERLKRLEEQSNQLVNQAAKTSHRSMEMCSKLDDLHHHYGDCSAQYHTEKEGADNQEAGASNINVEESAQTSEASTSAKRNPEEVLARREERLLQLEEQTKQLMGKVLKNSFRSFNFCRKLNRLHDRYGESSDSSDDDGTDRNNNTADGVTDGSDVQSEAVNTENCADPRDEADLHREEQP